MPSKILFIDSDMPVHQMVDVAGRAGLTLDTAPHADLVRSLLAESPRILVVDGDEHPGRLEDGIRSTRSLSQVPLIALVPDEGVGIDALRLGADAVVPRPVNIEELRLKIGSVLRRTEAPSDRDVYDDGQLELDRLRHQVRVHGREVDLTPTEFRMLSALVDHAGRVLSHERLLELVWGDVYRDVGEVKLYISYLRRKLVGSGAPSIETVRGIGYRYAPPGS